MIMLAVNFHMIVEKKNIFAGGQYLGLVVHIFLSHGLLTELDKGVQMFICQCVCHLKCVKFLKPLDRVQN